MTLIRNGIFKVRLWYWNHYRKPLNRPGQVVINRFSEKSEVLDTYLGPYIGCSDDKEYLIDEHWRTKSGNEVAVGYFWRIIP